MNPPEDSSWITLIADKAWGVITALIAVVWGHNQLAHKESRTMAATALATHAKEDEKTFSAIAEELKAHRGHIAKLFDQSREESQRSEERHRELMERVHDGHRELFQLVHQGLAGKADKS